MKKQLLFLSIVLFYKLMNVELVKEGNDILALKYAEKFPTLPKSFDRITARWTINRNSFVYRNMIDAL